MKMTKSEVARLGAQALNSDIEKKTEALEKAKRTNLARNPNYYRDIGRMGGRKRKDNNK
jgi:general stress protein YciG